MSLRGFRTAAQNIICGCQDRATDSQVRKHQQSAHPVTNVGWRTVPELSFEVVGSTTSYGSDVTLARHACWTGGRRSKVADALDLL